MKKIFLLLAAAALVAACSKEADNEPAEPVEPPTPEATLRLEALCEQLNSDLATLHTLIAADELPDCVLNVAPIAPDGETIGYGVSFKQNGAVILYFDPDATAQKFVPQFGVYEADGIRYWAMNGKPLPSATGEPVPVLNEEGIAPCLKAERGYWYVSIDDGANWWPAGQAPDGTTELTSMPLVSQVTEKAEAWSIVLADGKTALSISKEGTLHIAVDAEEPLAFQPHEIRTVHYTVTGGGSKTVVTAELEDPDGSYTMQVTPTDTASGSVAITAQVLRTQNILVTATDGSRTATATVAVTLRSGVSGTTVTVKTAGTLASLLNKFDKNAITELTVGGNLNSKDIETLKNLPNLAVLDMESANLKTLPNYAFSYKESLTAVKLPKNLTKIGNGAFIGCSGLTGNLVIPESVTTIGDAAFRDCSGLTSITILQGVTTIGDYAFYVCSGLTGDLVIPEGVTSIGNCAFHGCRGLTSVTIPASVTEIGTWAFYCEPSSLEKVYCQAVVPPTRIEYFCSPICIFFRNYSTASLYVPVGSAEAYKASDDDWNRFQNIIEMEF